MQVQNKIMYHYNNREDRKNEWKEGNIIDNTENYFSDFYINQLYFKPVVSTIDGGFEFFPDIIDDYLSKEYDKETYMEMLKKASAMLRNFSILEREMVLEQVRQKLFSNLPSRRESIYLCDREALEHWSRKLRKEYTELFKVKVTGELFKSSDILLPDHEQSIPEMYNSAVKYWTANLSEIDNNQVEYLFKGKIKVLEKID